MGKSEPRNTYSLVLSPSEKEKLDRLAKASGLSNSAYIRFMIFQSHQNEITSTQNPLASGTVPEINVKTYSALCDIAHRLREIKRLVESDNEQSQTLIMVDRQLLEETLAMVKKIGLQIASKKN